MHGRTRGGEESIPYYFVTKHSRLAFLRTEETSKLWPDTGLQVEEEAS